MRSLLQGRKIPLVKESAHWQFDLADLLSLGTNDVGISDQEAGMSYSEYLKMLLTVQGVDLMVGRMIDMVEHSISVKYEEPTFKVDQCISRIHMTINTEVGMGYTYEFPIKFGYR